MQKSLGNLGSWLEQSDGQIHFRGRNGFSHLLGGVGFLFQVFIVRREEEEGTMLRLIMQFPKEWVEEQMLGHAEVRCGFLLNHTKICPGLSLLLR